jgi:hypothetical protein
VAPAVEHLLHKCEALNSNPSHQKKAYKEKGKYDMFKVKKKMNRNCPVPNRFLPVRRLTKQRL